jgi:hypothetical protein
MIGTSCVVRQQQHKGTVLLSRRWPMDVGQERGRRRAVGFWGYWGGMWLLRFRVPPAVALLQPLHCCRPGARSPLPGLAVYHRDTPASWQGLVHTLIQVPRLEIVTPPKAVTHVRKSCILRLVGHTPPADPCKSRARIFVFSIEIAGPHAKQFRVAYENRGHTLALTVHLHVRVRHVLELSLPCTLCCAACC